MRAGGLPILPVALDAPEGMKEDEDGAMGSMTTYVPGNYKALEQLAEIVEDSRHAASQTGPLGSLRVRQRTSVRSER